jgi:hypothetical protein
VLVGFTLFGCVVLCPNEDVSVDAQRPDFCPSVYCRKNSQFKCRGGPDSPMLCVTSLWDCLANCTLPSGAGPGFVCPWEHTCLSDLDDCFCLTNVSYPVRVGCSRGVWKGLPRCDWQCCSIAAALLYGDVDLEIQNDESGQQTSGPSPNPLEMKLWPSGSILRFENAHLGPHCFKLCS